MKKKTTKQKGPAIASTYETEIEYVCPVRGLVKQKVKVKRIDAVEPNSMNEILSSKSIADKLDKKYSGLSMSDDSLEDEENDEDTL